VGVPEKKVVSGVETEMKNTHILVIGVLLTLCIVGVVYHAILDGSGIPLANEIVKERIPADNPYDPEVQPGRYSHYILTHPVPIVFEHGAAYTPTKVELAGQSSNIGFTKVIVITPDGTVRGIYPYDNGGPGFEHTTAYNEAHGLTVTVGGIPVPITWQIKGDAIYTTNIIEGTPHGPTINGTVYNPNINFIKPERYVGGTINPGGDIVGGHPSEEQMIKDRAVAGVNVIIDEHGNHIFSGENWREFAAMDKCPWKTK